MPSLERIAGSEHASRRKEEERDRELRLEFFPCPIPVFEANEQCKIYTS